MNVYEMEGFLRGKCLPGDMKVNESNAQYLVRKFSEFESKLSESQREFRAADATIHNLELKLTDMAVQLANAESKCRELAAENAGLNKFITQSCYVFDGEQHEISDAYICATDGGMPETQTTDAFLNDVLVKSRKEGAYFVANRMLAAWDAGFIDDTAKNAADIARMILTSTEFMAAAPEGDFDRSFADGVLEDIAAQIRKGAAL
ncbi:hypothetical protein [Citrobacter sp. B72]|uniref:hypothetical protein n=1 Tax=Citrobacter sp. B72 TaxID=2807631 RepID=UPI001EF6EF4D|nr:hypothetical protein [Citrobacter sp. B72]